MDMIETFCVKTKSLSKCSTDASRGFDFASPRPRPLLADQHSSVHGSVSFEDQHSKVHPNVLRIRMLRELVMLKHHKEGRNLLNSYIKYRMEMARMESWSKFLQQCKTLSLVPTRFRLKNSQMKKTEFLLRTLDRYSNQIMRVDMRLIRKRSAQLNRIIAEKVHRMRLLFGEQLLEEALEVTDKAYRRRMSIMDSEHDKELNYLNQHSNGSRVDGHSRHHRRPREVRTRDSREHSPLGAKKFPPKLILVRRQQQQHSKELSWRALNSREHQQREFPASNLHMKEMPGRKLLSKSSGRMESYRSREASTLQLEPEDDRRKVGPREHDSKKSLPREQRSSEPGSGQQQLRKHGSREHQPKKFQIEEFRLADKEIQFNDSDRDQIGGDAGVQHESDSRSNSPVSHERVPEKNESFHAEKILSEPQPQDDAERSPPQLSGTDQSDDHENQFLSSAAVDEEASINIVPNIYNNEGDGLIETMLQLVWGCLSKTVQFVVAVLHPTD